MSEVRGVASNTHYGMIVTSVPPGAELIVNGPESFCREHLAAWVAKHPLIEYDEAIVVAVVT